MNWSDLASSPLSDMLRDELVMNFIQDAEAEYRKHRALAGRFAECGNHERALAEIETANDYLRRAANWREKLEGGE